VIPAYNRAALVARAVQSARAQWPSPPAEIIVVDDASSDDTSSVAEAAGATVIRHERNRGEGAARNTAIREATQEWVALLDSDDEWMPGHLGALWPFERGRVVLGATAVATDGNPARDRLWGLGRDRLVELRSPADVLANGNLLVASSVLVRRSTALEVGAFREDMPRGADLDLWLRVLERGPGVVSPDITVRYHLHPGQVSDDRSSMWSAHRALLASYADRPWCTPRLRRAADAVLMWDGLRADLRAGARVPAASTAAALAIDPVKLASVGRLLAERRRVRRRSDAYRAGTAR
jgi:glycosyltransferase involved in cell wall biosynthesis